MCVLSFCLPLFNGSNPTRLMCGFKLRPAQTLTRTALKLAARSIDVAVVPPGAYRAMQAGRGPYAETADQAKELALNFRALFAFPAGTFHPVVWVDSGIDSWGNLDAMMNANALMRSINPDAPFAGMNAKLHPGAVRYYDEVGIAVPDPVCMGL